MGKRFVNCLFYGYLKLLERTVQIQWIQPEQFRGHHVVGFWHEDSFAMNLVLAKVTAAGSQMSVLVTGDSRGDYIEYMINQCKGKAIRMGFGFCDMGTLRDILNELKEEDKSVAIAMDGPLGPRHIPKKMTYFLSEKSETPLLGVTLGYSHKISLKNRWDHYRIPLPFSKITVRMDGYGIVSLKGVPHMRVYQETERCSIMNEDVHLTKAI